MKTMWMLAAAIMLGAAMLTGCASDGKMGECCGSCADGQCKVQAKCACPQCKDCGGAGKCTCAQCASCPACTAKK